VIGALDQPGLQSAGMSQRAGDLADAVAGGVWGLLVGDALGVPFEFRKPDQLPPFQQIEMPPPTGFRPTYPDAPAGAWSDDGAQALCLLASLLECGRLDLEDLAARLVRWLRTGYMAVGGIVFDVGMQTSTALAKVRSGVLAERAGGHDEWANGNGSLMRVLPLALWHRGSDDELVRDAARQSIVTHAHLRSQICCALYCLWVRFTKQGAQAPWAEAASTLRALTSGWPGWEGELDAHVHPEWVPQGGGTGYVIDCLHSARLAAEEPTFEHIIKRAVSLGHDTDTTAAVAGGLAGVRHGLSGIPDRWREALAGRAMVEPLVSQVVERAR
jgi:ADP-ribosyl-[dinitrogen reductase] hydrolase